ncbi:hypothetical protein [Globicatella sp. PHS-GS-PNBC-21-1553]|uniref:hypothetical protein n=1 Tax=Globicatella sp. PHS-GS-PNBC-21-1553 TaxID=2885764 RepID=UPI00298F30BC|nr:hypothetical protein [Globicatella sp. PHS-GS-PNBC-21-1553]WPC08755.1 hypothetical protein LB888_00405 [Globicatella sp. PHS-GS-PNBC-21-1553]
MTDKMMRIAGRGNDGLAKALMTNNTGALINSSVTSAESELKNIAVGAAVNFDFYNFTKSTLQFVLRASQATDIKMQVTPIVGGTARYEATVTLFDKKRIDKILFTNFFKNAYDAFRVSIVNVGAYPADITVFALGSETNVEIENIGEPKLISTGVTVSQNQTVVVAENVKVKDIKAFTIGLNATNMATGKANRASVYIYPVVNGRAMESTNYGAVTVLNCVKLNANKALTDKYMVETEMVSIAVKNHDSDPLQLDLTLIPTQNTEGAVNATKQMEYIVPTIHQRPSIYQVPVGTICMAIDTREMWISNGQAWEVY